MANNVNVKLSVVDDATTKLRRVEGEITNFTKRTETHFKKMASGVMAGIGGLFALNSIKRFSAASIESYKTQIQSEQKLTAALGTKNKALLDYASVQQSLTLYADDQIIQAQSMIAAFIKEEGQIKKVTKAAMDLATAKDMDLVSAADAVTKSIVSSTNALKRYGVDIEGAQGSTERLDSAVNSIAKAFGGMAEAMAQTDAGKIEQMKNLIDDTQEVIGEKILPLQLQWNQAVLVGVQGLSKVLTWYTKAAEIAGALVGGKSFESISIDNTVLAAKEMDKEQAKNYLFEVRQKKLNEIEQQEAKIKKLQEDQQKLAAMGYGRLVDRSSQIDKEKEKLRDLTGQSLVLKNAMRDLFTPDQPAPTGKGTSPGGDITGKQAVKVSDWFDKNREDSFKDAEAQYKKRIELNKQFEKMATESSEADVKARWEKLKDAEAIYQSTRLDAIKDPIAKEVELHKIKYAELEKMAGDNAGAILNIEKAKALDEARLEEFKKKTIRDNAKAGLDATVENLNQMSSQWKVFGGLYKTAAISQTMIDTYAGAQAAFKSLAGIPIVGPALGAGAAALAIGGGFARIAAIKKQKFASGTVYAPGGWSTVGENGPEEMYIPGGAAIVNNRESKYISNSSNNKITNNSGTTMNVTLVDNSGSITKQMSARIRDGAEDELVRMLTQRASRIMR